MRRRRHAIGDERVHAQGWLERRISNTGPWYTRWRMAHILNWEEANGPVPPGHVLKSIDGNKQNTDASNWELIPRGLLPRLHGCSARDYDKAAQELKPTIMAVARLAHQISLQAGYASEQKKKFNANRRAKAAARKMARPIAKE